MFGGTAYAATPIYNTHEDSKKVDDEFKNVYIGFQPIQFRVFNDTPSLNDLKNGEIVRYSSNTVNRIMWRTDQEIYSVNGSCVTIRR